MPSFETVSKEIESLLDSSLFCESSNLDRRRKVAIFDARVKIAEKIYRFLEAKGNDPQSPGWKNRVDTVVIMTLLDECLRNYQKMEGKSFLNMFMSRYAKRVPDPRKKPIDRIASVDGNLKGQRILKKLHEIAASAGIDPKAAAAEIKKLNQQNRLSPDRIRGILKLFHQSPDAINTFVKTYMDTSMVESFGKTIDGSNDESALTLSDTIAVSEAETFDTGINTELFELGMQMARKKRSDYEKYMRYTLTFLSIEYDVYSIDLEPFLDLEFYRANKGENYLPKYHKAAAEAKASGKVIQQDSFINNCRMQDFAAALEIQPDTWRKKFKECRDILIKAKAAMRSAS